MAKFDINTTGKEVVKAFAAEVEGKTFLITGPSKGGLGAEAAITLASANPAKILLAGRSESKITPVIDEIKKINPSVEVIFVSIDLADNSSVRKAADKINATVDKIDVLITSGGVMGVRTYTTSVDGVESHFAANHLGHFLLTNLILDKIIAAKGRIVNVSSGAYALAEVNTEDPNFDDGKTYNGWIAYARTKTAAISLAFALAERLHGKGVAAFAADPGMVFESQLQSNSGVDQEYFKEGHALAVERNGGKELPPPSIVSLQQGIASYLLASLDPSLREQAPAYIKEGAVSEVFPYASDKDVATGLWNLSEKLVGQKFAT